MALTEQIIDYADAGTSCKGFLVWDNARPGPLPAVLISHAWGGRQELFMQKARELARLGYAAFALDMYGDGRLGTTREECQALIQPFMADRALLARRITAALSAVAALPQVDSRRIAAIGYCFGGMCVLDLARSGAKVRGVVALHGLLKPPPGTAVANMTAKVLVLHGNDDPLAPVDDVVALEKELSAANVDWQMHVYGGTQHAFSNPVANSPDHGLVYNANAERRSAVSLLNFLEEVLR